MARVCPGSGLLLGDKCWYLSEESGTCAAACFSQGLNFSWVLAKPAEQVLPRLLGRRPVKTMPPWGRLECYSLGSDVYFQAQDQPHKSTGDTTGQPQHWWFPNCRLACPCIVERPALATFLDAVEPSVCDLPHPQFVSCCLQVPRRCWHGGPNAYNLLRSYRLCCQRGLASRCPFFAEPVAYRIPSLVRTTSFSTASVCVHKAAVSHDIIENSLRLKRVPHECLLLQRAMQSFMSHVRGRVQVVDIGANIGSCAVALAVQGADVLAFEPHPRTYALLNGSARRLGSRRLRGTLRAFNLALADSHRLGWLVEPVGNAGGSATGRYSDATTSSSRGWPIEEQTLDRVLQSVGVDRVDIFKIDVEGDELRALRGAQGIFVDPERAPHLVKFEFLPLHMRRRGEEPVELLCSFLKLKYALLVLASHSSNDLVGACWLWDCSRAVDFINQFTFEGKLWTDVLAVSGNRVIHNDMYFESLMQALSGVGRSIAIGLC